MTQCHGLARMDGVGSYKHGGIAVLGLTGAIGAGKSEAARILAAEGAVVLDADRVGHEILRDPAVRDRLVARFGRGILAGGEGSQASAAGLGESIDRARLAALVFSDEGARRDLEAMVHPLMRARFEAEIGRIAARESHGLVVLDAAILFEAGWDDLCDVTVYVDAAFETRRRRVARSRGWSEAMLRAREAAQLAVDLKRSRADFWVMNDGDLEALKGALAGVTCFLEKRAGATVSGGGAKSDARLERIPTTR